ncbi:MAG: YaeQ family protein [Planctomycetes bacterium]|nr:YaeQ family protein [Planctomycetota bacterium]
MGLPAMIRLAVALSDEDRSVWDELALVTAVHPSETPEFLAARCLAWVLSYEEGIQLSNGVSDTDLPAVSVRALDGQLQAWIEVGLPDPDRLHKAAKRAPRVAVFPHRPSGPWRERCRSARVHRAREIQVVEFDPEFMSWVASTLTGRSRWDVWVSAGEVRLAIEGVERVTTPRVGTLAGD